MAHANQSESDLSQLSDEEIKDRICDIVRNIDPRVGLSQQKQLLVRPLQEELTRRRLCQATKATATPAS